MQRRILRVEAPLRALRALGFEPAADVYQQSVVEEECTGNGALACLQRGYRAVCLNGPSVERRRLLLCHPLLALLLPDG